MKNKLLIGLMAIIIIGVVAIIFMRDNTGERDPRRSTIEDITFEEGVVNIYYFWGDGCAFCAAQFDFLDEIAEVIEDGFNLYSLEVWFNEDHVALMFEIAEFFELDLDTLGVPFMIMGDQTVVGFLPVDILAALDAARGSDFDVMQLFLEEN